MLDGLFDFVVGFLYWPLLVLPDGVSVLWWRERSLRGS